MALVLAGKLLAMRREINKLTLTIRPTTTTQQDGKTLVVMMEDTDKVPRNGQVVATGLDPNPVVVIEWNDSDCLLQFIQATAIDDTVRLEVRAEKPAKGSTIVTISTEEYTLVSFQRGGL